MRSGGPSWPRWMTFWELRNGSNPSLSRTSASEPGRSSAGHFLMNPKTSNIQHRTPNIHTRENGEMGHLTPALRSKATSGGAALSPFCSADSAKRGEGEARPAFRVSRRFGLIGAFENLRQRAETVLG